MLDGRNNRFFFPWEQMFFLMQKIFIVLPSNMAALQNLYLSEKWNFSSNMLVLGTSNFQGATIRPIVPRYKHSIVFSVHH